jgi:hypothetical protein
VPNPLNLRATSHEFITIYSLRRVNGANGNTKLVNHSAIPKCTEPLIVLVFLISGTVSTEVHSAIHKEDLRSFLYTRYARADRLQPTIQIPLNNQVYIWCHFNLYYRQNL